MKLRLTDIAGIIRSKNSGPYELTLDIMFVNETIYHRVINSGVFTAELFAGLYNIRVDQVINVVAFHPAWAIKATIVRPMASGDLGETDVYGAQQHAPLLALEIELPEEM